MNGLEFVGPEAGRWLQQEMTLFGGIVDRVVPGCFPTFARVLHRIDPQARAIRWSEICEMTGATAHPLMQWHLISAGWAGHSAEIHQGRSGGTDPADGSLDRLSMVALYEILSAATADGDVFHACWNGWGGMPGWVSESGPVERLSPNFSGRVDDRPLLELPGRQYLVFTGTLDPENFAPDRDFFSFQSPSLSWPADQTWCVATEIDFDSTVVAGSVELIAAVLAHPDLEAWPVGPRDSLQFDGDLINLDR